MTPVPTTKYVHQFRTFSGWDTVNEDDDVTPVTWADKAEADSEMMTFFQEIEAAVARGDMSDHSRADWRVVELEENQLTKYEVLISDVRVFKITVQASNLEAANELADAALKAGYEDHGELVEVRDPSVDDVQENQ